MDIAFCHLQGNTLLFAGAQRPLWICRSNELIEYKGTKMAIGGTTPDDQVFETHSITLQSGDMIYLSSDGYADQFGGATGKKMMTKNMKSFLSLIANEPTEVQKGKISKAFADWKGKTEQVDDVCVMGVRIG
jgi:serine phosphatase RsbU (regulator of sigma subunit)